MSEPDWSRASSEQIRAAYTAAGVALYRYLRFGARELADEAGSAWPSLRLRDAISELRRNYYAARALWRAGDRRAAARLMVRTGQLAWALHRRIEELARREPALLRRINALGLRPMANELSRSINATTDAAATLGSGVTTALTIAAIIAALVVLR